MSKEVSDKYSMDDFFERLGRIRLILSVSSWFFVVGLFALLSSFGLFDTTMSAGVVGFVFVVGLLIVMRYLREQNLFGRVSVPELDACDRGAGSQGCESCLGRGVSCLGGFQQQRDYEIALRERRELNRIVENRSRYVGVLFVALWPVVEAVGLDLGAVRLILFGYVALVFSLTALGGFIATYMSAIRCAGIPLILPSVE